MSQPFDALARIAELDSELLRLERSRASLPARVALRSIEERLSEAAQSTTDIEDRRQPSADALTRLEAEVANVATRAAQIEERLAKSTGAGRDLAAMDTERKHLVARQRELEDTELELMEVIEPLDAALATIADAIVPVLTERDATQEALVNEDGSLDAEVEHATKERSEVAGTLDPDLLARYERISRSVHGAGAARLLNGRCDGCHLELPTVEIDTLRRLDPEAIATCEQCGRILLRPDQLGD